MRVWPFRHITTRSVSRWGRASLSVTAGLALGLMIFPASAAYNSFVSWSDMSDLNLKGALRSQYSSTSNLYEPLIAESANELALRDADSLISPEFHVPPSMRESVEFWLKIYTAYSTRHVVLFDARHPGIVYEVLDFRELAKTARNAIVYELTFEKRVKKTLAAYRAAFARLASQGNPWEASPSFEGAHSARRPGSSRRSKDPITSTLTGSLRRT